MTSDPDQIRADIERTRARLSDDVNTFSDTVNPAQAARRQAGRARGAVVHLKDRVMGAAGEATDQVGQLGSNVSDAGSAAGSAVSQAPEAVRGRAAGNPLAAGLIAFGVGWLAGSLLPASQPEQQAAAKAKEAAQETVLPAAQNVAREAGEHLRQPAQEAAHNVQQAATQAAGTVQQEGRSAAGDLAGQAQDATESVKRSGS